MMTSLALIAAAAPVEADVNMLEAFGVHAGHIAMQTVSFGILAFVLYRFAIKPVLSTMDERNAMLDQGLKDAERSKAQLANAKAESKRILQEASFEAKAVVDEARRIAETRISKSVQEAAAEAENILAKAQVQIELDRKQMLVEARSEIARLVVATTAKVLAKELSAEDKSRFAESAASNLVDARN